MLEHRTDKVIADLVDATCGGKGGRRKRHVMRQALYALVRLAKVEQLMAMRLDAERAAGGMIGVGQRRHTKALLRKIGMDVQADGRRLGREWAAARTGLDAGALPWRGIENDCGKG